MRPDQLERRLREQEGILRSYEEIGGRRVDCVVFSLVPADLGWGGAR